MIYGDVIERIEELIESAIEKNVRSRLDSMMGEDIANDTAGAVGRMIETLGRSGAAYAVAGIFKEAVMQGVLRFEMTYWQAGNDDEPDAIIPATDVDDGFGLGVTFKTTEGDVYYLSADPVDE